ncbi:MAG: 4-carboxymuconolactone decarboxylase [Rhizobiaceae bacterium]|nr:4-carboxymuconolactone decarboxylase [Rhizobiaceae bacterium]MCV0409140.1 4-carboxymuconolactone decarboxylase [Rhizobiaceae bacterium]
MADEDKSERWRQGMATRRSVLGAEWVDRARKNQTDFDAPFQDLITEAAWGHVWSRDTISKRERSMMTLALLAGLGNYEELALHTRATLNTGCSRDDIREAMLHVAIYAGVPRANHAIKVIRQVFDEIDGEAQ